MLPLMKWYVTAYKWYVTAYSNILQYNKCLTAYGKSVLQLTPRVSYTLWNNVLHFMATMSYILCNSVRHFMQQCLKLYATVSYSLWQQCLTVCGNSVLQFMAIICDTVYKTFWVI